VNKPGIPFYVARGLSVVGSQRPNYWPFGEVETILVLLETVTISRLVEASVEARCGPDPGAK
jgi:hypothetical protein